MEKLVRVLRIVEYLGPEKSVQKVLDHSIRGTLRKGDIMIKAHTVDGFCEYVGEIDDEEGAGKPRPDVDGSTGNGHN